MKGSFKILYSDIYMQYEPDCKYNGEVDQFLRHNLINSSSGILIKELEDSSCAVVDKFIKGMVNA